MGKEKQGIGFRVYQITLNLVILLCTGLFAFRLDKVIIAIVVLFAYMTMRYKFDKTYPNKSTWICVILSILMMFAMIYASLPIGVSLLSGVCIASIDCYILYKVKDYNDLKFERQEPLHFNPNKCSQIELVARCQELGLSQDNIDFAVMVFIKKLKHKQIAELLCIEEKSVTTKKARLNKLLINNK